MTQMEVARQSYTVSCGEQGTSLTHTEATEQHFFCDAVSDVAQARSFNF